MGSWRWSQRMGSQGSVEALVGSDDRARGHQLARRDPTGRSDGDIHSTGPVAVSGAHTGLDCRAFARVIALLRSPRHPQTSRKVSASSPSGGGSVSRCPRPSRSLRSASSRPPGRLELGAFGLPYRPHPSTGLNDGGVVGDPGITTGWSRRVASLPAAQPGVGWVQGPW
jgi:hypothetical protein